MLPNCITICKEKNLTKRFLETFENTEYGFIYLIVLRCTTRSGIEIENNISIAIRKGQYLIHKNLELK